MSLSLKQAWCKVAEWCENPPWLDLPDLDNQQLAINCDAGTLEISGGNSVELADLQRNNRLVWSIAGTLGYQFETWSGADASGTGTTEAAFLNAWSGSVTDGIPSHIGDTAPTVSGFETDTRFSQSDSGQDEHRLTYWIHNDRNVAIELADIDGRAEALEIYAGCDCPSSLIYSRYYNEGAPWDSDGSFLTVPAGGLFKMTVLIHDHSAFSGFRPVANEVGDTATFTPTSYQDRPVLDCKLVEDSGCEPYELAEGESFKPLTVECLDCGSGGDTGLSETDVQALIDAQDHDDPQPATVLPLPDLDPGDVGTSLLYAREDHQHPCADNIPNPGYDLARPILNGPATEISNANFSYRSTDREMVFKYRGRLTADAATNGWVYYQAVSIAGYQAPEIEDVGIYYQTGSQDDTGQNTPYEEQYMGGNGVEWTPGRLYMLHFSSSRKFEDVNIYPIIKITYRKL